MKKVTYSSKIYSWSITPVYILLFSFTLACVGLQYFSQHLMRLIDFDAVQLFVLFKDLHQNGVKLRDWSLGISPYYFPDWLIYFPLYYLAPHNVYIVSGLYLLAQCVITFFSLYALIYQFTKKHALKAASLSGILLLYGGLFYSEPFINVLRSVFHFGAFLAALWALALVIPQEDASETKYSNLCILGIICFLAPLSDKFFYFGLRSLMLRPVSIFY